MKVIAIINFILLTLLTNAYAASNQVLITVGKDKSDADYAKSACDFIYDSINKIPGDVINAKCVWLQKNEMINQDIQKEISNSDYLFHIDYRELANKDKLLRILNLKKEDDTDYSQGQWIIEAKDNEYQVKIAKLIRHAFEVHSNINAIKLNLLVDGIKNSKQVELNDKGQFIDKLSGDVISGKEAYHIFKEENPKQKHYLRAGIEISAILGLAAIHYQIDWVAMSRDWDFPNLSSSWQNKAKTSNGYRFDDNSHHVNEGHAYAGTGYYMFIRSNGFNSLEAALGNLAASSAWEFLVEYREVVSLNDEVLTPLGGFAIGEAYHQIAKIFKKRKGSKIDYALNAIFDTPSAMHAWADRHYNKNKKIEEDFNPDFWSKVDIETALVQNSNKIDQPDIRETFNAQIINIDSFLKEGKVHKIISDTTFSEMLYSIPVNQKTAMEDFRYSVKNVLAAYYQKNIGRDKKGNLEGYSVFIGPSNGVDFYEANANVTKDSGDWMSVVNILGSTMRLDMLTAGYHISCTIDLFGDFAMVRSYVIDQYKAVNGRDQLTSILKYNNYYYGFGNTKSIGINISKGNIEFGANYLDHNYSSINGRYRDGNTLDQNLRLGDEKAVSEIYISYKLTKNLKFKLSYERTERNGNIKDFGYYEGVTTRKMGTIIYNFR